MTQARHCVTLRWPLYSKYASKYALISHAYFVLCIISIMYIIFFLMIPVRGPHQSEALDGCLVCLCLRPALFNPTLIR